MWTENGRFKWGKSSDYRRRITKAKPWEIVHHVDHNKKNNSKSNFEKVDWIGEHNKKHPEKAVKWWKARAKQLKNKN
jgi:hypothetical protein